MKINRFGLENVVHTSQKFKFDVGLIATFSVKFPAKSNGRYGDKGAVASSEGCQKQRDAECDLKRSMIYENKKAPHKHKKDEMTYRKESSLIRTLTEGEEERSCR